MEARYKRMLKGMRAKEEGARGKRRASKAGNPGAGVTGVGKPAAAVWSLYILLCGDGSFYTGVTNDLDRRFRMHQDGKASRFTRPRRPVTLVYSETCGTRSQALSRECAVKALGRKGKENLVANGVKIRVQPVRERSSKKPVKRRDSAP